MVWWPKVQQNPIITLTSDFGLDDKKMLARLSYTDFNGADFLKNTLGGKKLDNEDLKKNAPNIVNGIAALKDWSNSL